MTGGSVREAATTRTGSQRVTAGPRLRGPRRAHVPIRRPRASGRRRRGAPRLLRGVLLDGPHDRDRRRADARRRGDEAPRPRARTRSARSSKQWRRGDSASAVSRRFVSATKARLAELLGRDLSGLDVAVLMIDGIVFAKCCCVVALVVTTDGTKVPVGLWEGDTENTTVVKDLLADLVARGLSYEEGILCVLDGSKALAAGVRRVFGKHAVVQRCTLHKRRNIGDYLPKELAKATDKKLARAFNDDDWHRGLRVAKGIASQLAGSTPRPPRACAKGWTRCSPSAASVCPIRWPAR